MTDSRCAECGGLMKVGDYPFCHGNPMAHAPMGANSVISDECDITVENGFSRPTRFTSKSAHRDALAAKGYEVRVRHQPIPGTDYSPHTTDWSRGSVDLAAATAAVSADRGRVRTIDPDNSGPSLPITWTIRGPE